MRHGDIPDQYVLLLELAENASTIVAPNVSIYRRYFYYIRRFEGRTQTVNEHGLPTLNGGYALLFIEKRGDSGKACTQTFDRVEHFFTSVDALARFIKNQKHKKIRVVSDSTKEFTLTKDLDFFYDGIPIWATQEIPEVRTFIDCKVARRLQ